MIYFILISYIVFFYRAYRYYIENGKDPLKVDEYGEDISEDATEGIVFIVYEILELLHYSIKKSTG